MQPNYAMLATTDQITEEYLTIIRELLVDDACCSVSSPFKKDKVGSYSLVNQTPSPLHWSRQMEWPWAILESDLKPEHRVLDIGGSWAVMKYPIARRTANLVNYDKDGIALKAVENTIERMGFSDKIFNVEGDVRSIPFSDDIFDRVFCISVLEHIEKDHLTAIDEMVRMLKPGGVLMLSMDVVLSGTAQDFHVGLKEANEIMKHLQISDVRNDLETVGNLQDKVYICCLLIRWEKPI